jgi:hypothetical protein
VLAFEFKAVFSSTFIGGHFQVFIACFSLFMQRLTAKGAKIREKLCALSILCG